eukprot:scaffold264_cov317-Pinguiococcus_pyrenoidosus.AAC.6
MAGSLAGSSSLPLALTIIIAGLYFLASRHGPCCDSFIPPRFTVRFKSSTIHGHTLHYSSQRGLARRRTRFYFVSYEYSM